MLQEIQTVLIGLGMTLVVLLTALYLFYERILVVVAGLLHIAFALGLALATTSLILEGAYGLLAERAVESTGIPAQLREGDAFVRRVQSMPERILERVRHPFRAEAEPPATALVPPPPTPPPGALESSIVPVLERFTAASLRLLAFGFGLGLMGLGLIARSSVDLVLADRALRQRIEALEAQLALR
jgi:hypothetical protein